LQVLANVQGPVELCICQHKLRPSIRVELSSGVTAGRVQDARRVAVMMGRFADHQSRRCWFGLSIGAWHIRGDALMMEAPSRSDGGRKWQNPDVVAFVKIAIETKRAQCGTGATARAIAGSRADETQNLDNTVPTK
jgi:hypothetical protein